MQREKPYVRAAVELSTNGTTWQQVWCNGSALIQESAWSQQDIDLSAYADGQAAVFVRWTYTVYGDAWPSSGWNIDDIQLLGAPPRQVKFDPVAPVVENVGTTSATLRLQPAPTTPLTVQFTSSAPALVPSPAAVVVPAGATSVSVQLVVLDNTTLDGTREVLITPSASLCSPTPLVLTINDNDTTPPDTDLDGMPDAWETAHGLDPASSAGGNGALGDPDHDGLANFLEYAFGLDPQLAESTAPYSVQTATDPSTGQAELRFTYRRLLSPGVLKYSLLTSSDLLTWQNPVPQPAELSATPNTDATTETVVARLPLLGPRLFVRIQVERP